MKTINEILAVLRSAKPDAQAYFSFARCVPTTVDSWRGIYAEPALGWRPSGYSANRDTNYPTVAGLIEELEKAIDGRSFDGWKGGQYRYDGDCQLHVDNPGDCTNTEIVRIEVTDHAVTIHTEYEDT